MNKIEGKKKGENSLYGIDCSKLVGTLGTQTTKFILHASRGGWIDLRVSVSCLQCLLEVAFFSLLLWLVLAGSGWVARKE